MAGCFLCIKQALVGGFCGGCGANAFIIGAFLLWFGLKGIALWLYADESLEPGEVLVRAAEAAKVWMTGPEARCEKTNCASNYCGGGEKEMGCGISLKDRDSKKELKVE